MNLRAVTVLGAGTMGHGIAYAAMAAGYDTMLFDVSQEAVDKGRGAIEELVRGSVDRGKLTAAAGTAIANRLSLTCDLAAALADADFIVEAAPERIATKLELFAAIERFAPAHAIVTSNTSALSVTEMAATLGNPSRVAGMHFFNPVHKMKLVEVVRALETSDATLDAVRDVVKPGGTFGIELVADLPAWDEYRKRVSLTGWRRQRGGAHVTLVETVRQDRKRHLTIFDQEFTERRGRKARTHRFALTFRTLSVPQMTRRLEKAGFEVSALLGDYRGGPWDSRADVWMILARRPAQS